MPLSYLSERLNLTSVNFIPNYSLSLAQKVTPKALQEELDLGTTKILDCMKCFLNFVTTFLCHGALR